MISEASILSEIPADFIVQLRFKELQKISHKQPLKKQKLDSFFSRFCSNLSNVTCDLRGNQTSGTKTVRLSA